MGGAETIATTAPRPSQPGKSQEGLCQAGQELTQMQRSEHWLAPMGQPRSSVKKTMRKSESV